MANQDFVYCLATKKTAAEERAIKALPLCNLTHLLNFSFTVALSASYSYSPSPESFKV